MYFVRGGKNNDKKKAADREIGCDTYYICHSLSWHVMSMSSSLYLICIIPGCYCPPSVASLRWIIITNQSNSMYMLFCIIAFASILKYWSGMEHVETLSE